MSPELEPIDDETESAPQRGGSPDPNSAHAVERLKDQLVDASEKLPKYDEYFRELSDDVEGLRKLWIDSAGGARMIWSDDDTKVLLSCVLKIEKNKNQGTL